jgi:tyrosinase
MITRKNICQLSDAESDHLVKAMKELKKSKETHDWDELVDFHASHSDHIHLDYHQFLPWHRKCVRDFEKRLQKFDSKVSVPYWDWTKDREIPKPFHEKVLGWMNVSRAIARKAKNLPSRNDLDEVLAESSFEGFSTAIESLHATVHNWVGGTMANIKKSPKDPLFFLHHGFIDKVWHDWQVANPNAIYPTNNVHEPYESSTVSDVLDISDLDYRYV